MEEKLLLRLRVLLLVILSGITVGVSAQTVISGTVYDEQSDPLIGATVEIKEYSGVGTTTDIDGHFQIICVFRGRRINTYSFCDN